MLNGREERICQPYSSILSMGEASQVKPIMLMQNWFTWMKITK